MKALTQIIGLALGTMLIAACSTMNRVTVILPPGFSVVENADYALLNELGEGSKEAQERQKAEVERLKIPLMIRHDKTGIELAYIPAGEFMMGSMPTEKDRKDNEKKHRVILTQSFYMGVTEVTQTQWEKVMGNNPSIFKTDNNPVENVSWNECQEFCRKAGFSLPTEAQWEYACRAGTSTASCYGNLLNSSMVNFNGNYPHEGDPKSEYRQKTVPVKQFRANAWGLYDMYGNVWEWCLDKCEMKNFVVTTNAYEEGITDPVGNNGPDRILRGGGWTSEARHCRSASRGRYYPNSQVGSTVGFRVVLPVKLKTK